MKVIKKDSPEMDIAILKQLRDIVKSDIQDIRRRVNGILKPIEDKLSEWESLIEKLS